MKRRLAFDVLMRLYPKEYRSEFGEEMRSVFERSLCDADGGSRLRRLSCMAAEWIGLGCDAAAARIRASYAKAASIAIGLLVAAAGQGAVYTALLHWNR